MKDYRRLIFSSELLVMGKCVRGQDTTLIICIFDEEWTTYFKKYYLYFTLTVHFKTIQISATSFFREIKFTKIFCVKKNNQISYIPLKLPDLLKNSFIPFGRLFCI